MKFKGGFEHFDAFYQNIYESRWTSLKNSLLSEPHPIAFTDGLLKPYFMDEASIIAASLLPVKPGDTVLDMCAAPGGKTLVLASRMKQKGLLVSNDRSSQRRARLRKVIGDHIGTQAETFITVTSHDATKWGLYEKNVYDAILLDAPCSSERHVITSAGALAQWTPSRSKHLAIQQFAMLAAALDAVKIGGIIVYSTCSISSLENELIISKLHERRPNIFEELEIANIYAERLTHGSIILPDTAEGRGPLYFCVIRKTA
ncbi:MAG: RsmB/NOP family class I SAM-dependent RNA methyltransferase [Sphaerochaetaceae bacterium]|jgi:16S rRNA C967 or C1407 C5-methylase (RsmB/RsmF family)|nr:RsmB/NOP family class I SAM-dependent RNA methyltransferase [Sphaerochaetaceae bacterium]NLO61752.1 RsmB/NOP family class I SAM-dependent RNA methyltransferase [Spirochaetales bacterium]MDD2405444.1 RsmB/NOP family class I SAM-dependent RNA methyltransferase [Sphaerochaetaceae bacterium]MDD3671395.1 RsmB/NOP family class I SAM-dependent RNA methyltransferase [Sphaerochaetaceae bacterium]MDD4259366.1 RsmB/NOP family class I SAM-dependent RNA methyltransferase [Sphaerochaetaceae bacterium]